ncbi:unnamed protein product [Camellia sinensis]
MATLLDDIGLSQSLPLRFLKIQPINVSLWASLSISISGLQDMKISHAGLDSVVFLRIYTIGCSCGQ